MARLAPRGSASPRGCWRRAGSPQWPEATVRHCRWQQEADRGWEQARHRVGVAVADRLLLMNDLAWDLVQAPPEGIDIAAELIALVQIEVQGELLVALELVELRLDGGTEVGEHSGDGVDIAGCPVGEHPLKAVCPLPAARLDGIEQRAGDGAPQFDQLGLDRRSGVIGRGGRARVAELANRVPGEAPPADPAPGLDHLLVEAVAIGTGDDQPGVGPAHW